MFVPEGDEVTLTIERAKGLAGVVTVYWVIEESGWNDLSPNAGNVTFQEVSHCYHGNDDTLLLLLLLG